MNKLFLSMLTGLLLMSCEQKNNKVQKLPSVKLEWTMGENTPGAYSNSFKLVNLSDEPLDGQWIIYYSQIHRTIELKQDCGYTIQEVHPNFFKLFPSASYKALAPHDSVIIPFFAQGGLIKESRAPESAYLVPLENGKELTPIPIPLVVQPFNNSKQWNRPGFAELPYPDGVYMYAFNEQFQKKIALKQTDIFPSPKSIKALPGSISIQGVALSFPKELINEADFLSKKLHNLYGIEEDTSATKLQLKLVKFAQPSPEYYELSIEKGSIEILASTSHGIFDGIQTLLALMKNQKSPVSLNGVKIADYPDLSYRGLMFDVARNFTSKEHVLKLIDRLASYKIDVLHFHITDDEGWRLEIPGLEELTEVGSIRAHTLDESTCLYPNYSGGAFPREIGSGHYSVADFEEILKYAKKRHITVIPEIELPGHARAAIVSMKARYNKYIKTDSVKAKQYLLSNANDTSHYESAQGYSDNVVDVTQPSTYAFIDHVMGEIAKMYAQAGVPFTTIHVGGDEVPHGAKSSDTFVSQVAQIVKNKGANIVAWQEAALNKDASVNPKHLQDIYALYCWNTVPEWHGDKVPYALANAGYNVILSNVNNFYFDLSYSKHQAEPGLFWGGFVNEFDAYNMLPFQMYQSSHHTLSGEVVDLNTSGKGKPALNPSSVKHILGVQGQVFAETIRNYNMVEYNLFPKMFGLVERGWNANPAWSHPKDWSKNSAYFEALALYNAKITQHEFPQLQREQCNFRLSQPGIIVKDGKLLANTSIQGAEIRYTVDGTEPTATSPLWTKAVDCTSHIIKAKLFYCGKESVTTRLDIKKEI